MKFDLNKKNRMKKVLSSENRIVWPPCRVSRVSNMSVHGKYFAARRKGSHFSCDVMSIAGETLSYE